MAGKINVVFEDGEVRFCKVVESLGFSHDVGAYCKIVEHEGREFLVTRPSSQKLWIPYSARERVQPIRDHLERINRARDHQ